MKRFASHYLYLHPFGFLKQYIVEIDDNGYVHHFFPLKEEIESIIWSPGVIALFPKSLFDEHIWKKKDAKQEKEFIDSLLESGSAVLQKEFPADQKEICRFGLIAIRVYPFDFTRMKSSVDGIRYIQLR